MNCDWPVVYPGCDGADGAEPCGALAEMATDQQEAVVEMAVDYLWEWTGRMFGVCPVEVRPCGEGCDGNAQWASTFWGRGPRFDPGFPRLGGATGGGSFYPVLVSGQWFNMTCGCLGKCMCAPSGPAVLSLPGPVQAVTEVTVDGVIIPPESYRVDQKRWLVRTDGETWPRCQDMNAAADAVGSFVVRYTRGVPVPKGGQIAAGLLASELAMALCGDAQCALPENWQTLTRQGITITATPSDERGKTGIWLIDNWVTTVIHPRPIATVRSVDLPNMR